MYNYISCFACTFVSISNVEIERKLIFANELDCTDFTRERTVIRCYTGMYLKGLHQNWKGLFQGMDRSIEREENIVYTQSSVLGTGIVRPELL